MKVFVRADSSTTIGTGHVMRCLSLAEQLRKRGIDVHFISSELPGNISTLVEYKGFNVHRLPRHHATSFSQEEDVQQTKQYLCDEEAIDWLIVDHYCLDMRWEKKLRHCVQKIMVIDDLANRSHDCDLLLDQNLYHDMQKRYSSLVPPSCKLFLGPQYALLREEFYVIRKTLKKRDGLVRNILLFFGGSDPTNETSKALKALKYLGLSEIQVDVVVGKANPYEEEISRLCSIMPNTTFHCYVDNMAKLIAKADLGIGAGGTTTWERCMLGLPTITVIVADNQRAMTQVVADYGAILNLGWHADVQSEDIAVAIQKTVSNPEILRRMGNRAFKLMGANHVHKEDPVIEAMLEVYDA